MPSSDLVLEEMAASRLRGLEAIPLDQPDALAANALGLIADSHIERHRDARCVCRVHHMCPWLKNSHVSLAINSGEGVISKR